MTIENQTILVIVNLQKVIKKHILSPQRASKIIIDLISHYTFEKEKKL